MYHIDMIFNLDDFIRQKYLEKYDVSSVSNKNKVFKNYKKDKRIMVKSNIRKYAPNVSNSYIEKICKDKNNKIHFYGIGNNIKISEIAGICVTRRILNNKEKSRHVILVIAVHPNVRNCGYGTIFLDELVEFLKKNKKIEIILHSLKEAVSFYHKYGFSHMDSNNSHRFIFDYEGINENEEFHLLKLTSNN